MQLVTWDPFAALARIDRDFDELIRRTWGRTASPAGSARFVPAVEATRDGSDLLVRVELPGVDVDRDVEVTLDNGRLTIAGERRAERERTTAGTLFREVRYGSFRRQFVLPEGVGAEQVDATYDAGILTVRVRDAVATPAPVRVPIQHSATAALTGADETQTAEERPQS